MCMGSAPDMKIPEVKTPVAPVKPVDKVKELENEAATGTENGKRRRKGISGLIIPTNGSVGLGGLPNSLPRM